MKKTLLIIFFSLLTLNIFPVISQAYTGGLLNGVPLHYGRDHYGTGGITTVVTDNDESTFFRLSNSGGSQDHVVHKSFANFQDIDAYRIKATGKVTIAFYNEKNIVIASTTNTVITGVKTHIQLVRGVKKISVYSESYPYDQYLYEFDVFGPNYDEMHKFELTSTHDNVNLSWENPTDPNFSKIKLYKNGSLYKTLDKDETEYLDQDVKDNTEYIYRITALYSNGHETNGITKSIRTIEVPPKPIIPEVFSPKIESKYNRVNLSWKNPHYVKFSHVNIYRDEIKEVSLIEKVFSPLSVSAASTPIFETNGTYFNDLTVQPGKDYEYTLTVESDENIESEGVTLRTTTPEEPDPELIGGGYTKNENGDYLYTWTEPTTGQVKILIDEQEYQTVSASTKQILIPKNQMKYDLFNNPKVTLQPISETGKEGKPSKPKDSNNGGGLTGVTMPFGPIELLKSSMGLFALLAPILLLTLAIYYFKPLKNLIVQAVQRSRERRM
jgi:hypothetical protein